MMKSSENQKRVGSDSSLPHYKRMPSFQDDISTRTIRMSNSTNSCALIAMFNGARSSNIFRELLHGVLIKEGALGVIEEARRIDLWTNKEPVDPYLLRMLVNEGGDIGVELGNSEVQDPADFIRAMMAAIEKEVASEQQVFFETFALHVRETLTCLNPVVACPPRELASRMDDVAHMFHLPVEENATVAECLNRALDTEVRATPTCVQGKVKNDTQV